MKESVVVLTATGAVAALLALAQSTATNTDWSLIIFAGTCKRAVMSFDFVVKTCIRKTAYRCRHLDRSKDDDDDDEDEFDSVVIYEHAGLKAQVHTVKPAKNHK